MERVPNAPRGDPDRILHRSLPEMEALRGRVDEAVLHLIAAMGEMG